MSLNEAEEKVSQLENAIKRLDTIKKHLNQNALDIKAEIHANVSRNLECLRNREVTLLRQVDQVQRVKEEILQHQQARLNQTLGVLRTGLSMVLDQTASEKQMTDTLEKLNRIELSPEETPYVSFRADHINLRESILKYGRVNASGLPPLIAFDDPGNPSASLPHHIEEYEDVDHHIFYKTVEEVKRAKTSASSISVKIPKLSTHVEDWLQKKVPSLGSTKTGGVEAQNRKHVTRPSLLNKSGEIPSVGISGSSTPGSSCSLNNWLSLIKQHADLEEEHDFEIIDNSCSQKVDTKSAGTNDEMLAGQTINSDLKDWLFSGSTCVSKFSSTLFNHIPSDISFWLNQACRQLTDLEDLKHKDFCQDISMEPYTWLRSRAYLKQLVITQEVRDGLDCFRHISRDKDNWLQRQNPVIEKMDDIVASSAVNTYNTFNGNSCTKEDEGKWLLRSTASTPSFQSETSEVGDDMPRCASLTDCQKIFTKEKSPVIDIAESGHAFKSMSLGNNEWPSLVPHRQIKQSPTISEETVCGLFNHIPDASDSMWLMKTSLSSTSDIRRSIFSQYKFKDNKDETSLWLQKKSSPPMSPACTSVTPDSTSLNFSVSDWLLVPAGNKVGYAEEFHQNKEESEG